MHIDEQGSDLRVEEINDQYCVDEGVMVQISELKSLSGS